MAPIIKKAIWLDWLYQKLVRNVLEFLIHAPPMESGRGSQLLIVITPVYSSPFSRFLVCETSLSHWLEVNREAMLHTRLPDHSALIGSQRQQNRF